MSRTVSKILAIIAMVFVIPLMIVGTAFVAFYSTDKTINVGVTVDELAEGTVESPKIEYKEKLDTSHKITTGQNADVKVSAQLTSVAYTFQGWFAGTEQEYKAAVAANGVENIDWVGGKGTLVLSVNMQEAAENYVAVYNVVRYTVAWKYKVDPENGGETTDAPIGAKTQYKYGEALPTANDLTPKYEGSEYTFEGWQIAGAEGTTTRYTKATFPGNGEEPITLTDPWQSVAKATVKFHDENGAEIKALEQPVHVGETLDLSTIDRQAINAKPGYKYSWWTHNAGGEKDEQMFVVSPLNEQEINLYLYKDVIEYTAKLNSSEDATFNNGQEITFTVDDHANLDAAFAANNWKTKSTFWKFRGLTWSGAEYNDAAAFVTAFVAANPADAATAQLTAKIDVNYTIFSVDTMEFKVCDEEEQIPSYDLKYQIASGDSNLPTQPAGNETSWLFEEMFGLDNIANGTWYVHLEDGKHKVKLIGWEIEINGVRLQDFPVEPDWPESAKGTTLLQLIESHNDNDRTGILAAIESEYKQELHINSIRCIYEVLPETIQ